MALYPFFLTMVLFIAQLNSFSLASTKDDFKACLKQLQASGVDDKNYFHGAREKWVSKVKDQMKFVKDEIAEYFLLDALEDKTVKEMAERGETEAFQALFAKQIAGKVPKMVEGNTQNLKNFLEILKDCSKLDPQIAAYAQDIEENLTALIRLNPTVANHVSKEVEDQIANRLFKTPPGGKPFPWQNATQARSRLEGYLATKINLEREKLLREKASRPNKGKPSPPKGGVHGGNEAEDRRPPSTR